MKTEIERKSQIDPSRAGIRFSCDFCEISEETNKMERNENKQCAMKKEFPIRIRPEEMLTIKWYNSCGTKREKKNNENKIKSNREIRAADTAQSNMVNWFQYFSSDANNNVHISLMALFRVE